MHEVATVLQRISLHDDLALEPAAALEVSGFPDTLVTAALRALALAAGVEPAWRVRLVKRIPVAAGLGGGSSDAATAIRLANAGLSDPLRPDALHRVASGIGADVPFFLHDGAQLATNDGTDLRRIALPTEYAILLVLPHGETKSSTGAIYARFDAGDGAKGFDDRRAALVATIGEISNARDLAKLPANDLASSPLSGRLRDLGAFRADVSGAGPAVYGLFEDEDVALRAVEKLDDVGQTWVLHPA